MSFSNPRRGMPLGNIGRYSSRLLCHSVLSLNETSLIVKTILTLYHTILTFYYPEGEDFRRHWEKEKILVSSIFSFSAVFSSLSKREIIILARFDLSSAIAFNYVAFRISSFDKVLTLYHTISTFNYP